MIRRVDGSMEGGNAIVQAVAGRIAVIRIRQDAGGWAQWFHFAVDADPGTVVDLRLANAADCTYPSGWHGFRAWVRDGAEWRHADTTYAPEQGLTIRHRMAGERATFAYHPPYALDRHASLIARAGDSARLDVVAVSPEGRPVERVVFGSGPLQVWIVGRQHPGETMASWWMEGALPRLASSHLLSAATVHVVPLANPDGAARGYLRSNARGVDPNRSWARPHRDTPETAGMVAAMAASGVHLVLDVHGDECIPDVFLDGAGAQDGPAPAWARRAASFRALMAQECAALDAGITYPPDYAGSGSAGMLARWAAAHHRAVGLTLEMPFLGSRRLSKGAELAPFGPRDAMRVGDQTVTALERFADQWRDPLDWGT